MVKILSFDCAYCTLGVWYCDINVDYDCASGERWFDNVFVDVLNTLGTKMHELTDIEKARRFCNTIKQHPVIAPSRIARDTTVLIEHQPPSMGKFTNIHSTAASYQLAALYSEFDVQFVNPKRKQKISLAPALDYECFTSENMTAAQSYASRKQHSAANFRALTQVFKIDISHIPRAKHDDAADPIMNTLAYLYT